MKKIIHCVYINDYFPELWEMCLPTIKQYAYRTQSELNIITERKYSEWHINYEKFQVYEDGKHADCNFLIDAELTPDDKIFTQGTTEVVLDFISLGLLNGSQLDYVEDLTGAKFVIKNPNAASACGCGNSFSI